MFLDINKWPTVYFIPKNCVFVGRHSAQFLALPHPKRDLISYPQGEETRGSLSPSHHHVAAKIIFRATPQYFLESVRSWLDTKHYNIIVFQAYITFDFSYSSGSLLHQNKDNEKGLWPILWRCPLGPMPLPEAVPSHRWVWPTATLVNSSPTLVSVNLIHREWRQVISFPCMKTIR